MASDKWSPARESECLTCQAGLCTEHGARLTVTTTGQSAAPPPPAPEPGGEMSREALESNLTMLRDCDVPYETATRIVTDLFHHNAALRASRDAERARADRAEQRTRDTHEQALKTAFTLLRERDEAREQRDAATKRAREEEQSRDADGYVAAGRLAAAEAEVKRLKAENAAGLDVAAEHRKHFRERAETAEAENARLRAAVERLVGVGNGLASRVRSYSSMMYDSDAATMEAVSWTAAVAAAREAGGKP